MQKLNINGKNYSLPNNAADFLRKYLERLKEYTVDKKIDLELYQDIEERVAEKLDKLGKRISQKDVVDIVNSLGEPEEIFSDFEEEETPIMDTITKNGETFFKIVKENTIKATDYSKKKFKEIKQKLDDEQVVEKTKEKGKNVFQKVKNKAGKIKDNIEKKQEEKKTETHQKAQKEEFKEAQPEQSKEKKGFFGIIFGFFGAIIRMIKNFIIFIFGLIWTILIFTFKFLQWCLSFIIFGTLGFFFLAIVIALLIIAPLTYINFVIDNQEVFAYVPEIAQWSFIVMFVSGTMLMSASFSAALKQKWIPRFVTFIATTAFFIGLFGSLIGAYTVVNEYTNEYSKEYVFEFPEFMEEEVLLENFYDVHKAKLDDSFNLILPPGETFVKLEKSSDNILRFKINAYIRAHNQSKADKILAELVPVDITQIEDVFSISRTENQFFKNTVPLSILYYRVTAYVPENVGVNFDKAGWKYWCEDALVYSEEEERFVCEKNTDDGNEEIEEEIDVIEIESDEEIEMEEFLENKETQTTGSGVIIEGEELGEVEETGSGVEVVEGESETGTVLLK